MKKSILFSFLFSFGLLGCHKDSDTYVVSIDIQNPVENSTYPVNEFLGVKVNFTRENDETIHNVKVEVLDTNLTVINTLINEHKHVQGSFLFEHNSFKPTVAGTYYINAVTTDDDEEQPNTQKRKFIVN